MVVHLDFETKSRVDIVMEGAYKYAMDKSTSTLCLGVCIDDGEVRVLDTRSPLAPDVISSFNKLIDGGAIFKAFNANFERQIWRHVLCRENKGLKDIPILQWSCVAAKAMACGLPASLDSVAKYVTPDYRKDKSGSLLIGKLCKPRPDGTFLDDDKLHADLMAYCRQDVEVERQIDHALPDLIDYEKKVFALDQFINDRGMAIDVKSVGEARKIIAFETERREALLREATNGQLTDVRKIGEIKKYLTAAGHEFESLNKKAVADAVKTVEGDSLMVLKLRQELGQSSLAKYDALARCVCPDGRLHGMLMYHAAHTGRWGGRLVQPQNLPRGEVSNTHTLDISFKDMDMLELVADPLKVLSSAVRNMFVADEGETLIMADYSAIEARVLMWYAGCKTGVDIFTRQDAGDKDADIYVAMAREIYGDKNITKKDKAKRQLGKTAVLGLGYGMGKDKFLLTCQQAGMPVDAELAERAVKTFRSMFKEVPALWRRLEDEAMQTRGNFYRNTNYPDFLCYRLPSGRELRYYKAKVEDGELKYLSKEAGSKDLVWRGTYGGRLCENCFTADTLVVTMRGVVPIVEVTCNDKVWDGTEWVHTLGCVSRGKKEVGNLAGVGITADHLILVGNSWKSAIALTEESLQHALKSGASSVSLKLSKQEPGKVTTSYSSVPAAIRALSKKTGLEKVSLHDVKSVSRKRWAIETRSTTDSQISEYKRFGHTDILRLLPDVFSRAVRRIKTMADEVLKCTTNGSRTGKSSLITQELSRYGTYTGSISIELITTEITYPEICASQVEKKTLATEESTDSSLFLGSVLPSQNFSRQKLSDGKVKTQYTTISQEEEPATRLWTSTGKVENVYDLLNCGPNSRFTVVTARGPVIAHNCIQAMARDVMADAMLNLHRAGFKVVLTVHDEIVVTIAKNTVTESNRLELERIMKTAPAWAKGLPLNVESEVCPKYRK